MAVLNWIAFGLTVIAASGILLSQDWRWNIGLLAAQYLGFFWLVQTSWSISLASVKLVTGWMICVALGIAHLNAVEEEYSETSWPQGRLFRLAVIGLILIVAYAGGVGLGDWLGMPLPAAWGSLLLIGMGLLHTGITDKPFRVIVGLLTALSGFEIIYAAVESSALVTGLLALINLGLALVGAYFLGHQVEKVES
jgi:hypothetical protein